MSLGAAVRLPP